MRLPQIKALVDHAAALAEHLACHVVFHSCRESMCQQLYRPSPKAAPFTAILESGQMDDLLEQARERTPPFLISPTPTRPTGPQASSGSALRECPRMTRNPSLAAAGAGWCWVVLGAGYCRWWRACRRQ